MKRKSFARPDELRKALDAALEGRSAIGVSLQDATKNYLLKGRPEALATALADASDEERSLDVVVLHRLLLAETLGISAEDVRELRNISYVRGFDAAVEEVRSGAAQVAFLLRPVDVRKVARISFSGGVMPQKSTDFYPKLLSGLTVYPNMVRTIQVSAAADRAAPNAASARPLRWKCWPSSLNSRFDSSCSRTSSPIRS